MFHARLLVGDIASAQNLIKDWSTKNHVHPVDQLNLSAEISITITLVRKIQAFLSQKPFASKVKVVIVPADALTQEAQSALLKTLEEPPANSFIFLYVSTLDQLLPTIASRCQIELMPRAELGSNASLAESETFWTKVIHQKLPARLQYTSEVAKNRSYTEVWLTEQIIYFRRLLHDYYAKQHAPFRFHPQQFVQCLRALSLTLFYIKNNISLKMAVDHLFLNFPHLT